ncbi:MAG: hypothetical protein ABR583_06980 [Gaiellaceae bacterium]
MAEPQGTDVSDDLGWVVRMLVRPPAAAILSPHAGRLEQGAEVFAVVPSRRRPRLLVPLRSRRAAARTLRTHGYGASRASVAARTILAGALRAGMAQHFLRDRVAISLAEGGQDDAPSLMLTEKLRSFFAGQDVETAVRIVPARPNVKPLIQVMTSAGQVVGYAKVGWNDLTRALVRNESHVLAQLADRPARTFVAPQVLYFDRWGELDVLLVSAIPARPPRARELRRRPPVWVMDEIAARLPAEQAALGESAYWLSRQRRVAAAGDNRLEELAEAVEREDGRTVLSFRPWHGDWAPQNIGVCDGTVAVWDWERSGEHVPYGLDAAHFDVQLALSEGRRDTRSAAVSAADGGGPMLAALRLSEQRRRLLVRLDVLEMSIRWQEGQRAGVRVAESPYRPALDAVLGNERP